MRETGSNSVNMRVIEIVENNVLYYRSRSNNLVKITLQERNKHEHSSNNCYYVPGLSRTLLNESTNTRLGGGLLQEVSVS